MQKFRFSIPQITRIVSIVIPCLLLSDQSGSFVASAESNNAALFHVIPLNPEPSLNFSGREPQPADWLRSIRREAA